MNILLISDIHGNYPALNAVADHFSKPFDLVLNGGDTTVYGPFPNETINWLRAKQVPSILGNTDRHILTLLDGQTFKKPRKAEKRIMYGWTAAELSIENKAWLQRQPIFHTINVNHGSGNPIDLGMYHGSPEDPDEFLFANTPHCRFQELAIRSSHHIVTIGHSHSPFYRQADNVHFINPGSVGRMFDGKPTASCAVVTIIKNAIKVKHFRIPYPVEAVVDKLQDLRLPSIYQEMYLRGRKLN